jgi:hypothetical protein
VSLSCTKIRHLVPGGLRWCPICVSKRRTCYTLLLLLADRTHHRSHPDTRCASFFGTGQWHTTEDFFHNKCVERDADSILASARESCSIYMTPELRRDRIRSPLDTFIVREIFGGVIVPYQNEAPCAWVTTVLSDLFKQEENIGREFLQIFSIFRVCVSPFCYSHYFIGINLLDVILISLNCFDRSYFWIFIYRETRYRCPFLCRVMWYYIFYPNIYIRETRYRCLTIALQNINCLLAATCGVSHNFSQHRATYN